MWGVNFVLVWPLELNSVYILDLTQAVNFLGALGTIPGTDKLCLTTISGEA